MNKTTHTAECSQEAENYSQVQSCVYMCMCLQKQGVTLELSNFQNVQRELLSQF